MRTMAALLHNERHDGFASRQCKEKPASNASHSVYVLLLLRCKCTLRQPQCKIAATPKPMYVGRVHLPLALHAQLSRDPSRAPTNMQQATVRVKARCSTQTPAVDWCCPLQGSPK